MIPALLGLLAAVAVQENGRLVATIPEGCEAGFVGFSADGKVAAYSLHRGNQFWVVAGEWQSKPRPFPVIPLLLPSGKDVVYAGFEGRSATVYQNETALFEVPDCIGWWLPGAVTPDAKTILSFKRDSKTERSAVAINGKLQTFHKGTISVPVLSADGKRFAFALENDEGHCIVVNDKPGPTYDWVTQPVLTADGKGLAYGAEADKQFFIVYGEKKLPVGKPVTGVFLSPDGTSIGWWGRADKGDPKSGERVVVGDREGPVFATIRPPVFSPDGKHVTYRARKADKSWCVVVDDQTLNVGDIQVDPVFTTGSEHVSFGLREGRELWWKTVGVK